MSNWKYGDEIQTTYSGNVLDRLSFLREDYEFLKQAITSPEAKFALFRDSIPLLKSGTELPYFKLQEFELHTVVSTVGFYTPVEERISKWDPQRDAVNAQFANVVFLGLDNTKPSSFKYKLYAGQPTFAIDLTIKPQTVDEQRKRLERVNAYVEIDPKLEFQSVIFGTVLSNHWDYSVIAESLVLLDWATRNPFCAGCGNRTCVVHGGFKLICPSSMLNQNECPTQRGVNNIQFPRTDTCVIMAILSHDGQSVLLGRGRRFKFNMYSCLAGFLEGGESIEDCVRRETFEEVGLKVGKVKLIASQPWPYPANLMLGCFCQVAEPGEQNHSVFLGHDTELKDALWIPVTDLRKLCDGESLDYDFVLPPSTSIAFTLLDEISK